MPKVKLTAAAVERLKPPKSGATDYFDSAYPGLALRVTANGVRSWTYFGRVHGKLKRATIGRYPDLTLAKARAKAGETADAMRAGADPTAEKRRERRESKGKDNFETIARDWLKRDQGGNRSKDEVKRIIEREALGIDKDGKSTGKGWGDRKITAVTRRDVIELLDGIVDRGAPVAARRTHSYLHRLFRWAAGRGIIEANPMANLPKPGAEVERDRVLSDAELKSVWHAADAMGWPFGDAVKLLVLTASRRDEISSLRWAEIDIGAATIRLDGARTKTGKPREIALSPLAVEIVKALPKIEGSEFAFTTTGETPISGWARAKATLDAKIADGWPKGAKPVQPWRLHDLRRTVATSLQHLGVKLEVIEAVLGHVSGSRRGIVGTYQRHSFAAEARAALIAWGDQVTKIVSERPAKVVPIRKRSRHG
jgi:integrase